MDGTTTLELAGGGAPPNGSTAQVGVVDERRLLVTLKTDPDPGTVDIVPLHDGAVTGAVPAAISAPPGTLTPFGFSVGKYVFTANTGSKTISRLIGTGNNVFVDNPVAASIATGGAPLDIDTADGVLGVIDHGGGQSHLSLFTYNEFGELTVSGSPINLGVANANGVAIMAPPDPDEN